MESFEVCELIEVDRDSAFRIPHSAMAAAPAPHGPATESAIRNPQSAIGNGGGPAWYAIRTRSRHEKLVRDKLSALGVEPFLPLVDRWRRWKDRRKQVSFPLFPGYCFAHFALPQRLAVRTVRGVVEILGGQNGPIPVPEAEIEGVRRLVTSTLPYDPYPYLREGMPVEVIRGPLAGLRGILVRKAGRARLVIAIDLIQQAASVQLDAEDVSPVR